MPIYRCTIPQELLSPSQKSELASMFADVHCHHTTGTPRKFVHVLFEPCANGNSYTGGVISSVSKIVGMIRAGRSQEVRSAIVRDVTQRWTEVTGQPLSDVVVTLLEVRPKDTMEWGEYLPESGEEPAWIARHDLAEAMG
jgi:phenylpyruvate tautomerase PptA (4-oxalocrotonate tautomerase family)